MPSKSYQNALEAKVSRQHRETVYFGNTVVDGLIDGALSWLPDNPITTPATPKKVDVADYAKYKLRPVSLRCSHR